MRTTQWLEQRAGVDWRHRLSVRGRVLKPAWGEFLGGIPWDVFATLTFDPKRTFPISAATASREAFWWCGQAGRLLRRPVAWMYAPERHKSGRWHVHALLANVPTRNAVLKAIWEARNGLADLRPVRDGRISVEYLVKSAGEGGEIVLSDTLRRYRAGCAAWR